MTGGGIYKRASPLSPLSYFYRARPAQYLLRLKRQELVCLAKVDIVKARLTVFSMSRVIDQASSLKELHNPRLSIFLPAYLIRGRQSQDRKRVPIDRQLLVGSKDTVPNDKAGFVALPNLIVNSVPAGKIAAMRAIGLHRGIS